MSVGNDGWPNTGSLANLALELIQKPSRSCKCQRSKFARQPPPARHDRNTRQGRKPRQDLIAFISPPEPDCSRSTIVPPAPGPRDPERAPVSGSLCGEMGNCRSMQVAPSDVPPPPKHVRTRRRVRARGEGGLSGGSRKQCCGRLSRQQYHTCKYLTCPLHK